MWAAAALVALAGCSGSDDPAPTLAPGTTPIATTTLTPTTSAPATTAAGTTAGPETTAPVATTQAPTETIPLPNTEGEDDFEVIWRELVEYHNWAFQNPDRADADIYLAEECECYSNAADLLAEYRANGWRETSEGLIVHSVDVDISTSTFALMTVVDEHSELVVVDEAGATVRQEPRRPKTFYDVRIRLLDEGWRIVEWFQRGGIGDAE